MSYFKATKLLAVFLPCFLHLQMNAHPNCRDIDTRRVYLRVVKYITPPCTCSICVQPSLADTYSIHGGGSNVFVPFFKLSECEQTSSAKLRYFFSGLTPAVDKKRLFSSFHGKITNHFKCNYYYYDCDGYNSGSSRSRSSSWTVHVHFSRKETFSILRLY